MTGDHSTDGTDRFEVADPETGERLDHYEWNGWWWCENEKEAFDFESGDVECPHCGGTFYSPPPKTEKEREGRDCNVDAGGERNAE